MTEFSDWVRKRYLNPVIIVESSAGADAICGRSGLDAIHVLRRYSSVTGPLQASLGEKGDTVIVRNFGVRFQRTDCVREVGPSQILRHMRHLVWRAAELDLVCGEQLDRVLHDKLMENEASTSTQGVSASATASAAAAAVVGPSPRPQRVAVNTTAFNTLLERSRPPWHTSAVRDLHHLVRATAFETYDYPIGVVHVISSNEPGGVDGVLRALRAQLKRVHDMRADLFGMETELHTFFLLVHDMSPVDANSETAGTATAPASGGATATAAAPSPAPTLRDALVILAAMKQLYGDSYCALLKLNSVPSKGAGALPSDPTPWVDANPACMDVPAYTALVREQAREAARPDAASKSKSSSSSVPRSLQYRNVKTQFTGPNGEHLTTGCCLSRDDLVELESTMAYYIGQNLFRYLERRLRGLDVTVQDRRTTTLRKVAAWLSLKDESKPRAASVAASPDGAAPRYLATSVEMQMRRCGDLCMAFHHYDMAADYYKMCMEELIQTLPDRPYNKAMIAACQEGLGVAALMMDKLPLPTSSPWTVTASWTSTRAHNACRLELAQPMYVGAGQPLNALRLSLMMAEFCRTRMPPAIDRAVGQLKHILRSGLVSRTPLFIALIQDMLASAYIFTNPPYPGGLSLPPTLPASSEGMPVYSYVRRFAMYLMLAGQQYQQEGLMECALRCFLRVLEVFRSLGKARSWPELYERLLDRISTLYYTLGYDVKGLAMSSVAVLQGCRKYSDLTTGYAAFGAFWHQQERVLAAKGFGLSAHMVVPEVVRPSITIRRNTYVVDEETYTTTRLLGDVAATAEWRVMEHHLRSAMTQRLARHEETASSSLPATTTAASAAGSQHHVSKSAARLIVHLPRGAHGAVKQFANDDVVLLSRTATTVVTGDSLAASSLAASARGVPTGDSFVITGRVHASGGTATAPSSPGSSSPVFRMYLGEPLKVSVELYNPIGGPLTATSMCLLYVARNSQSQLWKTASTQTVTIAAQSRSRVNLSFDPVQEGQYVIIGLCWSILGQEGYYYFATRESRPGCTESLFEYAMAHPMPNADAPENVSVQVEPPEAWLASAFEPPLPPRMRDGEYFHTTLVLENKSTRGTARHITLQRSPQNAHLLFMGEFGLEQNLAQDAAFELAEDLAPGQVKKLSVVVRAQHDRGDVALTCYNHILLLFGFVSDASAHQPEGVASAPSSSKPSMSTTRAIDVRVHRLLRRFEVTPLLLLYSTVLPPTGPSLDTACVLTVKHIPVASKPLSHASGSRTDVTTATAAAAAGASTTSTTANSHETATAARPVCVSRVLVMHEPRWELHLAQSVDTLFNGQSSAACAIAPGSSLTMPIMVHRAAPAPSAGEAAAAADEAMSFKDTECLPLRRAVSEEAMVKLVETTLGSGIASTVEGETRVTGERDAATANADHTHRTAVNAFFVQTFFRGAGGVGSSTVDAKAGMEAMVFYKDKAGAMDAAAAARRSPAQRRHEERRQERAMYGAPLETYTPIAVAVAWLLHEDDDDDGTADGASREDDKAAAAVEPATAVAAASVTSAPAPARQRGSVCGQSFFLIDTMAFVNGYTASLANGNGSANNSISRNATPTSWSFASGGVRNETPFTNTSLSRALNGSLADGGATDGLGLAAGDVATLQELQGRLSRALWSHNSPRGDRGALVYKVSAPLHAIPSLSMPTAALAPVTFVCLSLSPVPLMVEVCAHDAETGGPQNGRPASDDAAARSHASDSVLFVGKTREAFFLPPSARHSLTFTAHVLVPGVIDCNRLRVRATPLLFQPGVSSVKTGMSACAFLRALRAHEESVNTSSYDSAVVRRRWSTVAAHSAADLDPTEAEAEAVPGGTTTATATATATAAVVQTRAALQSLLTVQTRRRSAEISPTYYSAASPVSPTSSATYESHRDAQASVELALSLLTPRGFLPSHVVVVGAEVPAMVHVGFPRMDVATQEAAATVFQRKNKVYHRDWHLFEANYTKFRKAQEVAWLQKQQQADDAKADASQDGSAGGRVRARLAAESDGRVQYIYRPRVKTAVDATGSGAVQFDDLDKLLASPASGAVSEANGSFTQTPRPNSARASTTTGAAAAMFTPPLKGSPSAFSASASAAISSGGSATHSSRRPRPPRLVLPQAEQTQDGSFAMASEAGRAENAQAVPEALFASPILHAAPPLSAAAEADGAVSPPTEEAAAAAAEASESPAMDLPTHPAATLVSLSTPSAHRPGPGGTSSVLDDFPLPGLALGEDSNESSALGSRIASTLLSPLHMPSPHRGWRFEQVMPVDSVRDMSEAEVAAAAEGVPCATITVPSALPPHDDDVLDDLFRLDDDSALISQRSTVAATPRQESGPSSVTPVFSRVVEHRAEAHPLMPDDWLAADVQQGMRPLPTSANATGVVIGSPAPVTTGDAIVVGGRASPLRVEGRVVRTSSTSASDTAHLSPVGADPASVIAGTPVQQGNGAVRRGTTEA